jgi:hypothetical protein
MMNDEEKPLAASQCEFNEFASTNSLLKTKKQS